MNNNRIHVLLPVALKEVFDAIAPGFVADTGDTFDTSLMLNPEVPNHITSGANWSLAFSNPGYIQEIVDAGHCEGGVQHLGYAPLTIAMRGAPTAPPLTDPKDIADLLLQVETIAVTTGGTSTAQFARLTAALGVTDETEGKLKWLPGGKPAAELALGTVDAAILPLTNVAPVSGIHAKAVCPYQMDVQVDVAFCIAAGANQAPRRFARWLLDPRLSGRLRELGLLAGVR